MKLYINVYELFYGGIEVDLCIIDNSILWNYIGLIISIKGRNKDILNKLDAINDKDIWINKYNKIW